MKTMYKYWMCVLMIAVAIGFIGCDKDNDDPAGVVTLNSNGTLSFDKNGGDLLIKFTATKDWTISIEQDQDWVAVSPVSGKAGEDISVTVTANANKTGATREADISISAGGEPTVISSSQVSFKLVSQIESQMGVSKYTYDAIGRLASYGNEFEAFAITYTNDNKVRLYKDTYTGNTHGSGGKYEYIATLDSDGKITSITGSEEWIENEQPLWKYNITATLTYTSKELTKFEYMSVNAADAQDKYPTTIDFTWENNSIKSCHKVDNGNDVQYAFTYATEKNDLNISILLIPTGGGLFPADWMQALFAADLTGKRSALLPSKTSIDGLDNTYTYTRTADIITEFSSTLAGSIDPTVYTVSYQN